MSTETLSAVAVDIATQYHEAGQHLLQAYETGAQRAATAFGERFASGVQASPAGMLGDELKTQLIETQAQWSRMVLERLRSDCERIASFNERLYEQAKNGIENWAGAAVRPDAQGNDAPMQMLASLQLASAQLSLSVAKAVADNAKSFGERVAQGADAGEVAEVETASRPRRAKRAA